MKVIIVAAGEGKRMLPLTEHTPKPLLRINGSTVLDHIALALPEEVTDLVIVVRYLGDQIKNYCGTSFHGKSVSYVEGSEKGNAYSLLAAAPLVDRKERMMVLYADEIPSRENVLRCLAHRFSWLCKKTLRPKAAGVVRLRDDGTIAEIVEKSEDPPSDLATIGLMVLSGEMFYYEPTQSSNGEYYLSSMANQYFATEKVYAVLTEGGCSLTKPEDIPKMEAFLWKQNACQL